MHLALMDFFLYCIVKMDLLTKKSPNLILMTAGFNLTFAENF